MSGVYLPYCLPPECCATRDPLVVGYTRGHFSALVPTEATVGDDVWRALGLPTPAGAPSVPVPLTDEQLNPLPLMFEPQRLSSESASGGSVVDPVQLLVEKVKRYCDAIVAHINVDETGSNERTVRVKIPVAAQRCPPRMSRSLAQPADAYFNADWRERLKELTVGYQT